MLLRIAWWVGAFALLGRIAAAQSAPSLIVIVATEPAGPTARRLSTDLQGIGLDVLVLRATPENSSGRESLEQTARGVGAIAAVRLVPSGIGTEVWVADRVTGKTVIRQLVRPSTAEAEPEDVALGAVELLRASLMELHASSPPHGEAEVTPAVRDLALPSPPVISPSPAPAPTPPQFSLMAGPCIDLGVRSLGPSLQGYWAAGARVAGPAAIRVFVSLPIVPSATSVTEGHVDVSSHLAALGVSYDLAGPNRSWIPSIGMGAAVAHLETVGTANAPLVSAASASWMAGGYAQASAAATLTRGVRLRLDASTIVIANAPEIVANGRSLGRWGAPAVLLSLGVEMTR